MNIDPEEDYYFDISYFDNLKDCRVKGAIGLVDWIELIEASEYSDLITYARGLDETAKDEIKVNQIPCVTINFKYKKYKKKENCIGATGLMYIDIDAPDFDISILNKEYVRCYYKSFSGKGYGIIVKVDGLTEQNFDATYFSVCTKLGIAQYVDLGAKKSSQFNVLSFDKELFDNPFSKIFNSINTPLIENNRRERRAYSTEWGVNNVRFSNRQDYIKNDEDYFVDFGNIEIIECKLLFKKVSRRRNDILLSYCTNLLYLNPNIYYERLYKIMGAVNFHNFYNPVDEEQLNRIVNSVISYHEQGSLKPHPQKKKGSIVFNDKVKNKYSKEEKFAIVRDINCKNRIEKSKEKIKNIISKWDFEKFGKITQISIVKNHSISKKTVEKYYSIFKEEIKIINSKFAS